MILKKDSGIERFEGFQSITGLLKPHRRLGQVNVLVDSLHPTHALNDLRGFLRKKGIHPDRVSFHELPDGKELVKRCIPWQHGRDILNVPEGFFGLIFSDGLFNQSSPIIHRALLEEMVRIMDPQHGIAMLRWVAKWPGKVPPESRLDIDEGIIKDGAEEILEAVLGGATDMSVFNRKILNLVKTKLREHGKCIMNINTPIILSNLVSNRMLPESMEILIHENGEFEFFMTEHAVMELLRLMGNLLQFAPLHVMESLLSVQREKGENFWVNRFVLTRNPDVMLPPHLST